MDGMVDGEGGCWVEGLVVGREGYGSVMFPGFTNVARMNLDEIGGCVCVLLASGRLISCTLI